MDFIRRKVVGQRTFSSVVLFLGSNRIFISVVCECIDDLFSIRYLFIGNGSYRYIPDIDNWGVISFWHI